LHVASTAVTSASASFLRTAPHSRAFALPRPYISPSSLPLHLAPPFPHKAHDAYPLRAFPFRRLRTWPRMQHPRVILGSRPGTREELQSTGTARPSSSSPVLAPPSISLLVSRSFPPPPLPPLAPPCFFFFFFFSLVNPTHQSIATRFMQLGSNQHRLHPPQRLPGPPLYALDQARVSCTYARLYSYSSLSLLSGAAAVKHQPLLPSRGLAPGQARVLMIHAVL
jgi:hypothetical protein